MLHTNNDISCCACVFTVVVVFFLGGGRVGGGRTLVLLLRCLFEHSGKKNRKSLSDVAPCGRFACTTSFNRTGSLNDPITWYKFTHAGEQVAQ